MPVTTPATPHESVTTMASPHVSVTAPASPHESVTTPATPQMPAAAPATQQKPVMAPATQQVPVMASPTHGISTATASNRDDAVRTWRQMEPDDAVTQRAFKGAQAPHISVRGESVDIIIKAIFNDDFWELLVEETNLYADQYFGTQNLSPHARARDWVPVTVPEMKKFIGLWVLTGLDEKPAIRDYWSNHPLRGNQLFKQTMTSRRFELINQFLHFADNSAKSPDAGRLYKVQPLLDHFGIKLMNLFYPGQALSLDEAVIPWKGRLNFRTYNPMKPVKYGIKVYALCDSSNGYLLNFDVYCGKGPNMKDRVLSLTGKYLNKGHILYMDNFYNSVTMSRLLLRFDTGTCGTLRANRGQPEQLHKAVKRLRPGEACGVADGDCAIVSWKDKKVVTVITTEHNVRMTQVTSHRGNTKMKPVCVADYNRFMNGVDLLDQNLSYYNHLRRSVKWTKKVFQWLVQTGLFNASLLQRSSACPKTQREVIETAVMLWLQLKEDTEETSSELAVGLHHSNHRLVSLASVMVGKTKHPQRKCVVCKKRTHKTCAAPSCATALCKACFPGYH